MQVTFHCNRECCRDNCTKYLLVVELLGPGELARHVLHYVVFADTYDYENRLRQSLQMTNRAFELSRLCDLHESVIRLAQRQQQLYPGLRLPERFDLASLRQEWATMSDEIKTLNNNIGELVPLYIEKEFLTQHRDCFAISRFKLSHLETLTEFSLRCFYRLYRHHTHRLQCPTTTQSEAATVLENKEWLLAYFTSLLTPEPVDDMRSLKTRSPLEEPWYAVDRRSKQWIYWARDGILCVKRTVDIGLHQQTTYNVRYSCELPSRCARHMSREQLVERLGSWGCLSSFTTEQQQRDNEETKRAISL
jgi:hypothetical protein